MEYRVGDDFRSFNDLVGIADELVILTAVACILCRGGDSVSDADDDDLHSNGH